MVGTAEERKRDIDILYPSWEKRTLWTQLLFSCVHFPEREFLVFEDVSYTYKETASKAEEYARSLLSLGVTPGAHVAVCMYNCPEYLFLTFALSMVGAVKVAVNFKCGQTEFENCLEDADAVYLITNRSEINIPPKIKLKAMVCDCMDLCGAHAVGWRQFLLSSALTSRSYLESVCLSNQDPDSISDILFTSGSSARAKCVLEIHDRLLRNAYATARTRCYEIGRRIYISTPLSHVMAYVTGLLPLLMIGGTAVFSVVKSNAEHDISILQTYRVNDIICMPSQIAKILSVKRICPSMFPFLHAGMWTACPASLWDDAAERFGIHDLTHAYGMTECCANLTMTSPLDAFSAVKESNGCLLDAGVSGLAEYGGKQMEMRICSFDTGEILTTGKAGEIQFRGLCTTPGYYNNESANKRAFTSDGWFKSNDCGYIDSSGRLHFIQRRSEMYKINGENVSPYFVENVLSGCEQVNDIVCVGIPHEKYGAIGIVFADSDNETEDCIQEIYAYCKAHLASYQIPAAVYFLKRLHWPLTASGKIDRTKLAADASQMYAHGGETADQTYSKSGHVDNEIL